MSATRTPPLTLADLTGRERRFLAWVRALPSDTHREFVELVMVIMVDLQHGTRDDDARFRHWLTRYASAIPTRSSRAINALLRRVRTGAWRQDVDQRPPAAKARRARRPQTGGA